MQYIGPLILVQAPHRGKIEHKACDRPGPCNFVCRFHADFLAGFVNQNLVAIWIDQPSQLCAVGDPGIHLPLGPGEAVTRRQQFDHESRRKAQEMLSVLLCKTLHLLRSGVGRIRVETGTVGKEKSSARIEYPALPMLLPPVPQLGNKLGVATAGISPCGAFTTILPSFVLSSRAKSFAAHSFSNSSSVRGGSSTTVLGSFGISRIVLMPIFYDGSISQIPPCFPNVKSPLRRVGFF